MATRFAVNSEETEEVIPRDVVEQAAGLTVEIGPGEIQGPSFPIHPGRVAPDRLPFEDEVGTYVGDVFPGDVGAPPEPQATATVPVQTVLAAAGLGGEGGFGGAGVPGGAESSGRSASAAWSGATKQIASGPRVAPRFEKTEAGPDIAVGARQGENPFTVADYKAMLDEVRKRGGKYDETRALSRAGEAINAAFMGRKATGGADNFISGLAGKEQAQADQDISLDQMRRKQLQEAEIKDPSSHYNQVARSNYAKAVPGLAKAPGFDQMTEAQLQALTGVSLQNRAYEASRRDRAREDAFRRESLDEQKRHAQVMESRQTVADARAAQDMERKNKMYERSLTNDERKAIKPTTDFLVKNSANLAHFDTIRRLAPELLSGDSNLLTNKDLMANYLAKRLISDQDKRALENAMGFLGQAWTNKNFGGSLTQPEIDRTNALLGGDPMKASILDKAMALGGLAKDFSSSVAAHSATGYQQAPQMMDEYLDMTGYRDTFLRLGGQRSRDIALGGPSRRAPAVVPVDSTVGPTTPGSSTMQAAEARKAQPAAPASGNKVQRTPVTRNGVTLYQDPTTGQLYRKP